MAKPYPNWMPDIYSQLTPRLSAAETYWENVGHALPQLGKEMWDGMGAARNYMFGNPDAPDQKDPLSGLDQLAMLDDPKMRADAMGTALGALGGGTAFAPKMGAGTLGVNVPSHLLGNSEAGAEAAKIFRSKHGTRTDAFNETGQIPITTMARDSVEYIPHTSASYSQPPLTQIQADRLKVGLPIALRLGDVLNSPSLFSRIPSLENATVVRGSQSASGLYPPGSSLEKGTASGTYFGTDPSFGGLDSMWVKGPLGLLVPSSRSHMLRDVNPTLFTNVLDHELGHKLQAAGKTTYTPREAYAKRVHEIAADTGAVQGSDALDIISMLDAMLPKQAWRDMASSDRAGNNIWSTPWVSTKTSARALSNAQKQFNDLNRQQFLSKYSSPIEGVPQ